MSSLEKAKTSLAEAKKHLIEIEEKEYKKVIKYLIDSGLISIFVEKIVEACMNKST